MGKLVVVQGDSVAGTDKHNVTGTTANPAVTYAGIGDYKYKGSVTSGLSTFVKIGGKPAALVTSNSSLDPGETVPPTGGHSGPTGSGFLPPAPPPNPTTLQITDHPIGTGVPNASAGSALLTISGTKVLLDGDPIDTCDGTGRKANSTVTAHGQIFVSCSQ